MVSVFHISGCAIENQVKFSTCTILDAALTWWNGHLRNLGTALTWWNGHVRTLSHDAAYAMTWGTLKKKLTDKYCPKAYTQCFQELALMCTKFLANVTKKINKHIGGLPENIHGNVMFARPKTLDDAIELANDLMDQKLRTYAERQNVKANNNKKKNQKAWACYECGNGGHIKKNCLKLKNCGNGNGDGVAQGRDYALGGRDASTDSNVITGSFLLTTVVLQFCLTLVWIGALYLLPLVP
nr:hypothetical protein [Tanacetum cinerariifolium]